MFLAHYGVAMAAKGVSRKESLGSTVMAAQWLDLLWPVLLLLGLESVRIVPGLTQASALDFVHYPFSHSLLAVAGWAVAIGGIYFVATRRLRGAAVVGGLVLSHWVLDLLVHRPDLPLWPGSGLRVGLGLWHSAAVTLVLELGFLALGLAVYARVTRPRDRIGRWGLWTMILVLVAFFVSSFAGPPPSESALGVGGLVLWIFVPWAFWIDRHRTAEPVGE
ncbi:MAG: hypothetical protein AMS18_04310 [Gemmatimonas sp. SG8_17]|nr:MAG: hypothetical protein AMS18_04310 [Gemmatimonas sp. SG8_17]